MGVSVCSQCGYDPCRCEPARGDESVTLQAGEATYVNPDLKGLGRCMDCGRMICICIPVPVRDLIERADETMRQAGEPAFAEMQRSDNVSNATEKSANEDVWVGSNAPMLADLQTSIMFHGRTKACAVMNQAAITFVEVTDTQGFTRGAVVFAISSTNLEHGYAGYASITEVDDIIAQLQVAKQRAMEIEQGK